MLLNKSMTLDDVLNLLSDIIFPNKKSLELYMQLSLRDEKYK